jgi:hypothetical protein
MLKDNNHCEKGNIKRLILAGHPLQNQSFFIKNNDEKLYNSLSPYIHAEAVSLRIK